LHLPQLEKDPVYSGGVAFHKFTQPSLPADAKVCSSR